MQRLYDRMPRAALLWVCSATLEEMSHIPHPPALQLALESHLVKLGEWTHFICVSSYVE